jgi:hypothetical protein
MKNSAAPAVPTEAVNVVRVLLDVSVRRAVTAHWLAPCEKLKEEFDVDAVEMTGAGTITKLGSPMT